MRRDFIKKKPVSRASPAKRWALAVGLISLTLCAGGMLVHYRSQLGFQAFSGAFSKAALWIAERKQHWHQNMAKVKQLTSKKEETDLPIHFEFYTALPNMRIIADDTKVSDVRSLPAQENNNTRMDIKPTLTAAIVDARELEQELSRQIYSTAYILQIGLFRSKAAASHYRDNFIFLSYKPNIVKSTAGQKEIYRVQIGPFQSKDQAANLQKQLQRRGINCLIRKVDAGKAL